MMRDKTAYVKPEIEVIEVIMEEVIAGLGSGMGTDDMDPLPSEPKNSSSLNPFGSFPSYRD